MEHSTHLSLCFSLPPLEQQSTNMGERVRTGEEKMEEEKRGENN